MNSQDHPGNHNPYPPHFRGWVLYDGDCRLCISLVQRLSGLLRHYHFEPLPLQTDWIIQELGSPSREVLLKEMRVLTINRHIYGGAPAVLYLLSQTAWGYPIYLVSFLPGMRRLLSNLYQWIANRRHCADGHCELPPSQP